MTISPEAISIARAVTPGWMNPNRDAAYRDAQKAAQLAINSATAPLQKEIERLRGEVEKAYREGFSAGAYSSRISHITVNGAYVESRAKRVAEGKE